MSVPEKKNGGNNTPVAVAGILVLLIAGFAIYKIPRNEQAAQPAAIQIAQPAASESAATPTTQKPAETPQTSGPATPRVIEAPQNRTPSSGASQTTAEIQRENLSPTIHDHEKHFGYTEEQRKKIAWDFMGMFGDAAKKALKDDPSRGPEIGQMIQDNQAKGRRDLCKKYHLTEIQLKTIADEASDKNWPQPNPSQTI